MFTYNRRSAALYVLLNIDKWKKILSGNPRELLVKLDLELRKLDVVDLPGHQFINKFFTIIN